MSAPGRAAIFFPMSRLCFTVTLNDYIGAALTEHVSGVVRILCMILQGDVYGLLDQQDSVWLTWSIKILVSSRRDWWCLTRQALQLLTSLSFRIFFLLTCSELPLCFSHMCIIVYFGPQLQITLNASFIPGYLALKIYLAPAQAWIWPYMNKISSDTVRVSADPQMIAHV